MLKSDDENLVLASSVEGVDHLNAQFYERFPYPWPAIKFSHFDDPYLETLLRNQDIGDWRHATIPRDAEIWVAGCGTNQAIFMALKFPRARVVGSDVSSESLAICARTARQLGIDNLELRQESINHVPYEGKFDFVASTGVIHHNYDPSVTLRKIAGALKPTGVLELMVYNRFHWAMPATFQKAMRILGESGGGGIDIDRELPIARKIVAAYPATNALSRYLEDYKDCPESMFADVLLQPVLHSYTVESLEEMAESCGLELLAPCLNAFDRSRPSWNLQFEDPEVQSVYDALPDTRRWHVANLLLYDGPPNLWFYLQPKAGRPRKTEQRICEEFLDASFTRNQAREKVFIQQQDGSYKPAPEGVRFTPRTRGAEESKILERVAPGRPMRDIFREVGIPTSFQTVNNLRLRLTTSMYPLLLAESPS